MLAGVPRRVLRSCARRRSVRSLATTERAPPPSALARTHLHNASLTPVQRTREAERRRFGLPVWQLLAAGGLIAAAAARWYARNIRDSESDWAPEIDPTAGPTLQPFALVQDQSQVEALLTDVRLVLAKHGISVGKLPLRVVLGQTPDKFEGTTRKALRPPPVMRGVEAITLRPGLTCIHAAQVLAHEYTHAWLWLQGFPPLELRVEEGLCEPSPLPLPPLPALLPASPLHLTCTSAPAPHHFRALHQVRAPLVPLPALVPARPFRRHGARPRRARPPAADRLHRAERAPGLRRRLSRLRARAARPLATRAPGPRARARRAAAGAAGSPSVINLRN